MKVSENSGPQVEPVPAGLNVARCVGLIEIGTVNLNFSGKSKRLRQVRLVWEFPDEMRDFKGDGNFEPWVLGKDYTISLNEKANLRQTLESWRGRPFTADELKGFELNTVVGIPCMINIIHDAKGDKVYPKIVGVSPMHKGLKCPKQITETTILEYDNFDMKVYEERVPLFVKTRMETSDEWLKMIGGQKNGVDHVGKLANSEPVNADDDFDDLPF